MNQSEALSTAPLFMETVSVKPKKKVVKDNEVETESSVIDLKLQVKLNMENAKAVVHKRSVLPISKEDVDLIGKNKVNNLSFRDLQDDQTDADALALKRSLDQVTTLEYAKRRQSKRKVDKTVDVKDVIDSRREQERRQYLKDLDEETKFSEKDSVEFPNWTFYIPDIVTAYGLYDDLQNPGDTEAKRKWLNLTADKGKVYYTAVLRVKDSTKLTSLKCKLLELRKDTKEFQLGEIPEEFEEEWLESVRFIDEFSKITKNRSKQIKLEYAIACDNVRRICKEVPDLDFVEFFGIYKKANKKEQEQAEYQYLVHGPKELTEKQRIYQKYMDDIDQISKDISEEEVYVRSVRRKCVETERKRRVNPIVGKGQYFGKRWNDLTEFEKKNRIASYVNIKGLIGEAAQTLCDTIWKGYTTKALKYHDFKWKAKFGQLQDVQTNKVPLVFNPETGECTLPLTKEEKKAVAKQEAEDAAAQLAKEAEAEAEGEVEDIVVKEVKQKKSRKGKLTVPEAEVNEFVLKLVASNRNLNNESLVEKCEEDLYNGKKLTKRDQQFLHESIKIISSVVQKSKKRPVATSVKRK